MARKRKRQPKVAIKAYKRKYKQAVKLAKEGNDFAQEYIEFIGEKLKRNSNEFKKRDIRSNKQRKAINDATDRYSREFEKLQNSKKRKAKQEQGLINAGYADNREQASDIISLFAVLSEDRMKERFGFSCEEIMGLADNAEDIGIENVKKVAQWIQRDMESNTPSYVADYLQEDDTYKLADLVMQIIDEEKISPEDLEMAFSEPPTKEIRDQLESGQMTIGDYLDDYFKV